MWFPILLTIYTAIGITFCIKVQSYFKQRDPDGFEASWSMIPGQLMLVQLRHIVLWPLYFIRGALRDRAKKKNAS